MHPSHLENKWQRLQEIVNQHSLLLQPTLAQQFKKLVITRFINQNLIVFFIQYIGLMSSTLTSPTALLWFASGTSCAFVFMRGYKILPGIWLGSFFAFYFSGSGVELAVSCATINVLQTFFLFLITLRHSNLNLIFYDRFTLSKFIFCSILLTGICSLLLLFLCYPSIETDQTPVQLWMQWWLANFNGLLIFASALVSLDFYFPQINALKKINLVTCKLIFGLLILLIVMLMFSRGVIPTIFISFMIMLCTVFINLKYRWCGTVVALFLIGFLLSIAASLNAPIFTTIFAPDTFFFLQTLLCIEVVGGWFIATR